MTAVVLAGCSSGGGDSAPSSTAVGTPTVATSAEPLDRLSAGCVDWATASSDVQDATTRQSYEQISQQDTYGVGKALLKPLTHDLIAAVNETTTQACRSDATQTVYVIQSRIILSGLATGFASPPIATPS